MRIDLDVSTCADWHKVEVFIKNGTCEYNTFDLLTFEQVETLELELTRITQKLYEYRQRQKETQ